MTKKKIIEIEEYPGQGEDDMSINELMRQEYGTWDEHDADYYDNKTSKLYKKKLNKIKKAAYGGLMKKTKPINMATGGLMNMPPFIKKSEEEKEMGITAYDVNTPNEARQGLPSRLLAPSRTRFEVGGNLDKDGSGDITQKDILIARGVLDGDGNLISKKKAAYGGLMKRQKYNVGQQVAKLKEIKLPIDDDVLDEDTFEEAPAEGDIPGEANAVKDILIKRQIEKLEAMEAVTDDSSQKEKTYKYGYWWSYEYATFYQKV